MDASHPIIQSTEPDAMQKNRRMTTAQFDLLQLQDTRIKPANQRALFDIFVNGRSQRALAAELGIDRSAMSQLVRKVWQRYLELPDNEARLKTITVTLPERYERDLHAWIRQVLHRD
ncbi:TrfB-related DNA-binding protein [Burkholderia stagnalis]